MDSTATGGKSGGPPRAETRVVLIDPEAERPPALAGLVEGTAGIEVIADLATPADAERIIRELRPQVVIVDILLPGGGRELIEGMNAELPNTYFLALTSPDPPVDRVLLALRAGALGFIERNASSDELAAAVQTVSKGQPWLPNRAASSVLLSAAERLELTARERTNRMLQMLLALIPLTGILVALLTYLLNQYWGTIGVSAGDIGANPGDQVIDVIFLLMLLAGAVGPLLFVPRWTQAFLSLVSRPESAPPSHRKRLVVGGVLALLTLAIVALVAIDSPLVLAIVVGPFIVGLLSLHALGFADDLPRLLRIEWVDARRPLVVAAAASAMLLVVIAVEFWLGPDIRRDGLHGFLAPVIVGNDIKPVRLRPTSSDKPEVNEAVLLGASGPRYVLYDPCNKHVVYIPTAIVTAEIIDEVRCPG